MNYLIYLWYIIVPEKTVWSFWNWIDQSSLCCKLWIIVLFIVDVFEIFSHISTQLSTCCKGSLSGLSTTSFHYSMISKFDYSNFFQVCYLVQCQSQQLCKTEPLKEPTIRTRIVFVNKPQAKKSPGLYFFIFCYQLVVAANRASLYTF